jgi:hypothetical protein
MEQDKMSSIENNTDIKHYSSTTEVHARDSMLGLMQNCPIPQEQLLSNIGLFLDSKNLSRLLFLDHLYRQIVDLQGVVMEFGTRWGQNGAVFSSLRSIYEPFNRHRKIVLFDTFEGFPSVAEKDGQSDLMQIGQLMTTENYDHFLSDVMSNQEAVNPLNHIKKYEICKGEAAEQLEKYLTDHPETIISLGYFDFDLYEPTKNCLNLIKDRLVKGSVLGFDELNDPDSPGETLALMESFGLRNIALKRYRYASRVSYFTVE